MGFSSKTETGYRRGVLSGKRITPGCKVTSSRPKKGIGDRLRLGAQADLAFLFGIDQGQGVRTIREARLIASKYLGTTVLVDGETRRTSAKNLSADDVSCGTSKVLQKLSQ